MASHLSVSGGVRPPAAHSLILPVCVCEQCVCPWRFRLCWGTRRADKSAQQSHSHATAGCFVSSRVLLTASRLQGRVPQCVTGFLDTDVRWWGLVRTPVVHPRCVDGVEGTTLAKYMLFFFGVGGFNQQGWENTSKSLTLSTQSSQSVHGVSFFPPSIFLKEAKEELE